MKHKMVNLRHFKNECYKGPYIIISYMKSNIYCLKPQAIPRAMPPPPHLLSDLKYTSNITLIISIHTALTLNLNQSSVKTFKLVCRAPKMSKVHNRFKRTMQCHIFHKKLCTSQSTLYCTVY